MRVAVFGASGFVGATFVERMLQRGGVELRAFIHSAGNAWRLTRHGTLAVETVDLCSREAVRSAVKGCTHVVNCSRGEEDVMIAGLHNLLGESAKAGVQRFVHLSSVAVYGDPPPPESVREDAPARPERESYGGLKLRQDRMVSKAARAGLSCVNLCPPNISGPHSFYLLSLVDALRTGSFFLVDEGRQPCVLVDVENLSHAIERALAHGVGDGQRLFITDGEETTWRDVVEALAPLAEPPGPCPTVPLEEARRRFARTPNRRASPLRSLKHLLSSDVRAAMRKDPLWAKLDEFVRGSAALLGSRFEDRMRRFLEGPIRVAKVTDTPKAHALCAQQLRGVRHSCARAKEQIGYDPPLTFARSMQAFRHWHDLAVGAASPAWDLYRELWRV